MERWFEQFYDEKYENMIPTSYLPRKENGSIDVKMIMLICQTCIVNLKIDKGYVVEVIDFNGEDITEYFAKCILRYKESLDGEKATPISSPFTANKCPSCNANLGGKLLKGGVFENPYFSKCPVCGTKLKKLSWQL